MPVELLLFFLFRSRQDIVEDMQAAGELPLLQHMERHNDCDKHSAFAAERDAFPESRRKGSGDDSCYADKNDPVEKSRISKGDFYIYHVSAGAYIYSGRTEDYTDGSHFPSRHDEYDSGAWEMTVHDLAIQCGLHVPEAKLERFSENGSTFLVKRFDRDGSRRIHFSSAMTLLGQNDGDSAEEGCGYLDLASFLKMNGAAPKEDLIELWKRIVFYMAVSNTDDHLRNHGFLLTNHGWRLSPLYDVNPCVYGTELSLNVSEEDNSLDYALAIETAPYYGISRQEAEKMVSEISGIVSSGWQLIAKAYGLGRRAVEYMKPAFSLKI